MTKSKNKVRLGVLIVSVFVLITSVSYALWSMTLQQTTTNVVNTACFKINFKDQNEINLQSAYPITDEEGMRLTPYTFIIENVCNTTAFYQVNLEELTTELKKLSNEYIKVSLNSSKGKILNSYTEVDKTLENATMSHRLTSGSLKENESKTFELRLWLDENTPAVSDVMNATFKSKIMIIAIQKEDLENDFTEENKSLNETFSNKEETIEFKAISKDYNIIEVSEDNVIYNPIENPSKEVIISKTYTVDGTYTMYFKDEVGNIIESTAETTKLDQKAPIVNFVGEEYLNGLKIDASKSSDEKSGIKKYYYKIGDGEFIESTESTHEFLGLSDGTYKVTVKIEDYANNFSEEKELEIPYRSIYEESILNGTNPVIKNSLIPVTIENDGTVKKADLREEWYSYTKKNWANAVILKNESTVYKENEVIPESNIESYFVWIPRYRYKIFNDTLYNGLTDVDNTKVQEILVEFEKKDTTPSTGTKKNEWLTHPAFTSFDSNGFWVGKFETSKSNTNAENSRNPSGVQIKPNVVSWRNIQVGNAFYTSYDYKRDLDSHMMKNTEWGAVAYLQHSKYGSMTSVRFNNHSGYLTGYASTQEPTCGVTGDNRDCNKYGTAKDITLPYNTTTGYLASTTGNISGIYDMSGGLWEYMMAVMTDSAGNPLSGASVSANSGFSGGFGTESGSSTGYSWPTPKYYDQYAFGTNDHEYTRRILGDATGEIGPFRNITYANSMSRNYGSWYTEFGMFASEVTPWLLRGGNTVMGSGSGIFSFGAQNGFLRENAGFRIILTPQN